LPRKITERIYVKAGLRAMIRLAVLAATRVSPQPRKTL